MIRFWKNDEFYGAIASPARRDGDSIFFVDEVTEFTGVELRRRWRVHTREEN